VEQVNQLLDSDLPPLWRAWVTTAVMLGLRPGELAGLAWADVGDDGCCGCGTACTSRTASWCAAS
jgi:integrase